MYKDLNNNVCFFSGPEPRRKSPVPPTASSPVPLRKCPPPAATIRNCASPWRCQPGSREGQTRRNMSSNSSSCHTWRSGSRGPTRVSERTRSRAGHLQKQSRLLISGCKLTRSSWFAIKTPSSVWPVASGRPMKRVEVE